VCDHFILTPIDSLYMVTISVKFVAVVKIFILSKIEDLIILKKNIYFQCCRKSSISTKMIS